MIISRAKAGWLMIAAALFIFGLADHLPETSLVGLQNVLFFTSIGLVIGGIYFVRTSKPCPRCGETLDAQKVSANIAGTFSKTKLCDERRTQVNPFRAPRGLTHGFGDQLGVCLQEPAW